MLAQSQGRERSLRQRISKWWSDWSKRSSASSELKCCAEQEIGRTAKDFGISTAELRKLASHGPASAELLLERMVALDLDRKEVFRVEPQTFRDLQTLCTACESKQRCERDLARDPADPGWKDYCPNAATLIMLNALPWASRREW